jgi:cyclopropane-fatty-acyl-phospholipid synthase
LAIRLWNGDSFSVGAAFPLSRAEAPFVLVFHHPRAVSTLVLGRDPLRLERAYYRGEVDIEGDLLAALALRDHLKSMRIPFQDGLAVIIKAIRLRNLAQMPR